MCPVAMDYYYYFSPKLFKFTNVAIFLKFVSGDVSALNTQRGRIRAENALLVAIRQRWDNTIMLLSSDL